LIEREYHLGEQVCHLEEPSNYLAEVTSHLGEVTNQSSRLVNGFPELAAHVPKSVRPKKVSGWQWGGLPRHPAEEASSNNLLQNR